MATDNENELVKRLGYGLRSKTNSVAGFETFRPEQQTIDSAQPTVIAQAPAEPEKVETKVEEKMEIALPEELTKKQPDKSLRAVSSEYLENINKANNERLRLSKELGKISVTDPYLKDERDALESTIAGLRQDFIKINQEVDDKSEKALMIASLAQIADTLSQSLVAWGAAAKGALGYQQAKGVDYMRMYQIAKENLDNKIKIAKEQYAQGLDAVAQKKANIETQERIGGKQAELAAQAKRDELKSSIAIEEDKARFNQQQLSQEKSQIHQEEMLSKRDAAQKLRQAELELTKTLKVAQTSGNKETEKAVAAELKRQKEIIDLASQLTDSKKNKAAYAELAASLVNEGVDQEAIKSLVSKHQGMFTFGKRLAADDVAPFVADLMDLREASIVNSVRETPAPATTTTATTTVRAGVQSTTLSEVKNKYGDKWKDALPKLKAAGFTVIED